MEAGSERSRRGIAAEPMSRALTANLKALLGERSFVALAEAFGGTRLYIPHTITPDHEIARAIGFELAVKLSKRYAPDTLRVPLAREDRAVHYRANGLSNVQIARKLGMTEAGIDQMFGRMETPPVKGSALQLSFLD